MQINTLHCDLKLTRLTYTNLLSALATRAGGVTHHFPASKKEAKYLRFKGEGQRAVMDPLSAAYDVMKLEPGRGNRDGAAIRDGGEVLPAIRSRTELQSHQVVLVRKIPADSSK